VCFAHHDRRDGRFALAGFKAEAFEAALEKFCVAPEALDELFARVGIEELEGGLARGGDGWRMRRGEQERAAAMIEEVDEVARAANIAADGTDGFAERADLNVNASVAAQMIDGTASVTAQDAGGVRIVDHHDAIVFFGETAKLRKRRDVALHRKNAVGDK